MNAVIYARYSSHNQTEQSIEGQLQACHEYAETNEKYGGFSKETIEKYNIPNVAWSNQESNA